MIRIMWDTAVAGWIFGTLSLVFGLWIFYNLKQARDPSSKAEDLRQCPICSLVIFDYRKTGLIVCPHCHSLIGQDQNDPLKKETGAGPAPQQGAEDVQA